MRVALTFDDGPSPFTDKLLDLFEEHGQHATFFVLGSRVRMQPWTVGRALRAGHEVGLHGYTHTSWPHLSDNELIRELNTTASAILRVAPGGWRATLCRPPHHAKTAQIVDTCGALGLKIVGCDLDPGDWYRDAPEILKSIYTNAKDGDIIDLHDAVAPGETGSRFATVSAVRTLLEEGWESVTVSELWSER